MEIYMELRPGAGGEEAFLFLQELMSGYEKYAKKNNLVIDVPEFYGRTITLVFDGKGAEKFLGESGVHRVQRESKGKLHTSTVTVHVFKGVEPDFHVSDRDFRFETYRASGNGGQHRNTTDSAVRLVHVPTGTVVTCASERSQYKNKSFAMSVMLERLREKDLSQFNEENNSRRASQVGTGDRAEARRTYNYQRKEVTDNITGLRISLKEFFKGNFSI